MRHLVIVMTLLLCNCIELGVDLPETEPPEGWEKASIEALSSFGYPVLNLEEVEIRWYQGDCLRGSNPCEVGLYLNGGDQIALIYRERISETSLVHELLHWTMDRHGVPDHSHSRVAEWENVYRINEKLAAEGL